MRSKVYFLVLFTVLIGCSGQPTGADRFVTLKIYHTNDIHSHLRPDGQGRGGLAYLASVLRIIREQEPQALILDAGDFYKKGSLPAQKTDDEVTADILNLMPYYDLRAVGNNEVKVGITKMVNWSKTKEHAPLLAANLVDKNGRPLFQPDYVIKKNGLTIGIVGMTPPLPVDGDAQADSGKDKRAPYSAVGPENTVIPKIKSLRPNVDVLILLAHNNYRDNVKLAQGNPEIDLVVSGHSHVLTRDQKKSGGGIVVEAGEFGRQLGVVTLVYDRVEKKVVSAESTFWPIGPDMQLPEKRIGEMIEADYKKYAPEALEKIGEAEAPLKMLDYNSPFEGSLHDWVNDTLCAATKCDVGLVNREMLREALPKGPITREGLFMASPYKDQVAVVPIGRKKLEAMLEESIKRFYDQYGMMQWSFTKARSEIKVDGEKQILRSVKVRFNSAKQILNLTLPHYVVGHCADFFAARYCPLKGDSARGEVREVLLGRILEEKIVRPEALNRVGVSDEDTSPAPVEED